MFNKTKDKIIFAGPFGSGKTTIASNFPEYELIDSKSILNNFYSNTKSQVYQDIIYLFGKEMLINDTIDKYKVLDLFLKRITTKRKIYNILFPPLRKALIEKIDNSKKCIVELPYYYEMGVPNFGKENELLSLVLIGASSKDRIDRLISNGLDSEKAIYYSDFFKIRNTDLLYTDLYINNKDLTDSIKKVKEWMQKSIENH